MWQALSDPTRRAILDLLRDRPRTTGEIAAEFPVSRFAVMKHLSVLVAAGLVVVRRSGRERWNHLNAVPLREMYERWVRPYEAHWASRLIGLAEHVEGGDDVAKTKKDEPAKPAAAPAPPGGPSAWTVAAHETSVRAPAERVWRALTEEIGAWWRPGFYALGNAKGMRLEPTIGGRMYEHADDGSAVVWFTVIGIQPGRSLDLAGHISLSFGGPAVAMVRFDVVASGKSTTVKVSEARVGSIPEGCAASAKQGWRMLLDEGLKAYCERE